MPRQPRLDAPGALRHVMGRGIETSKIFKTKKDREDFIDLKKSGTACLLEVWTRLGRMPWVFRPFSDRA